MGNSCSLNYANLSMGKFEEDFEHNNNPYFPFLNCWYRYINDIFFIFSGTLVQLGVCWMLGCRLLGLWLRVHTPIWLEYGLESINLLDVEVFKKDQLSTSIFRKKTDADSFLHFSSFHPPGLKMGLETYAIWSIFHGKKNLRYWWFFLIYIVRNCVKDS